MVVMVTGGAGYIGSHAAKLLQKRGFDVIIYDDLSTGHRESIKDCFLVTGDIADDKKVSATIKKYGVQAVMHFAASSMVGESVQNPAKYVENNVLKSIMLLNQLLRDKVKYIIFSSSAAVYGEPVNIPITEGHPANPANPYGDSKYMLEKILQRYYEAYGIKYVSMRYFNAAGADLDGEIGEDHSPETHLIPLVLQAALGIRDKVVVFGNDYETRDGTAVRDYIHVNDLAEAHILALEALTGDINCAVYNLGTEQGFTVQEVINAAKNVTGRNIKCEIGQRRAGDPAVLVASSEKIRRELGWQPQYNDLEQIICTAWKWHQTHPQGYKNSPLN
jgi:UDP-glucose 4-epimerase